MSYANEHIRGVLEKLNLVYEAQRGHNDFTREWFQQKAATLEIGRVFLASFGSEALREGVDAWYDCVVDNRKKPMHERPSKKRTRDPEDAEANPRDPKRWLADPSTISDKEIERGLLRCARCPSDSPARFLERDHCYLIPNANDKERGECVCLGCWQKNDASTFCSVCGKSEREGTVFQVVRDMAAMFVCDGCDAKLMAVHARYPTPTVVCLRRRNGVIVQDCDLYIGRRCNFGGWDLPASVFANPYKMHMVSDAPERRRVIEEYEQYVRNNPDLMELIPHLAGKTLGCWCSPAPCHGDVLVKLFVEWRLTQSQPQVAKGHAGKDEERV